MTRGTIATLIGAAMLAAAPATAQAGGFSFGFSYGHGGYYPAYHGGCGPVVYAPAYYAPVVYRESYCAPVVYSRPAYVSYPTYARSRVYYTRPRHTVYYRR
jgi:hypothetical protein